MVKMIGKRRLLSLGVKGFSREGVRGGYYIFVFVFMWEDVCRLYFGSFGFR